MASECTSSLSMACNSHFQRRSHLGTSAGLKRMGYKMEDDSPIDPKCMKCWIAKIQDTTTQEVYLALASEFDKVAQSYGRIVDHYNDLQKMAQNAAEAHRKLAKEKGKDKENDL